MAAEAGADALEHVAARGTVRDQLVGESGEELLQGQLSPGEQPVGMSGLRDATTVPRVDRKVITVDDHHLGVGFGEDSCRQKARHTGT